MNGKIQDSGASAESNTNFEPGRLLLPSERIRLLKAGFSEKEIQELYLILNRIEIAGEAVTKRALFLRQATTIPREIQEFQEEHPLEARVNAASSAAEGVSA